MNVEFSQNQTDLIKLKLVIMYCMHVVVFYALIPLPDNHDNLIIINVAFKMHKLFEQVLEKKDLSKAGDLFSLEDSVIVDELSEVLKTIQVKDSIDHMTHVSVSSTRISGNFQQA